jgi:putative membrane protein
MWGSFGGTMLANPLFASANSGDITTRYLEPVLFSIVFAMVGIVVFGIAFWFITKVTPFSIRKEIEQDQNTALGIVIGSIIIGLSLIISSAIKG